MRKVEDARLLREAEALRIPWREILEAEIRAETVLFPLNGDLADEPPLERLLAILPETALDSWRVREAIHDLSWRARPGSSDGADARRQIRVFGAYLGGRSSRTDSATLRARHLLLAYRRIRELITIRRCAAKCAGTDDERAAAVAAMTRCSADDARCAVASESARRAAALDDAVRHAREEGFEIPRARSAARTVLRMRDFLRRRGLLAPRKASGSTG
jgi:hypothetical protein